MSHPFPALVTFLINLLRIENIYKALDLCTVTAIKCWIRLLCDLLHNNISAI